ncbi:MAG: flavodoxin family protein [Bacteroidaceae bacterium]|nr:flavodoxin family protein [Bacteroidaceae bacterium]
MEKKQIKAIFVNGSPRKNKNTADMLQSAMRGAQDLGAECEIVDLYDIDFKGCKSCFACQLKNAKTDGVCAIKDGLRPLLERCRKADVIVVGSPVYLSYPSGETRSFLERLVFPNFTYDIDEQGNRRRPIIEKQTAMIFTMNIPAEAMAEWNYPVLLGTCEKQLRENFGNSETLYVCNTYQFNDYSRYAFTYFSEEDKRRYRDEHYDIDLQNAYELGKRLVQKAEEAEHAN